MNKYFILFIALLLNNNIYASSKVNNLIVPVSYFVNHITQLKAVENNLAKYKTASIVGISGIGKSQLARMYAYEHKENYNLIWFFDCNLDLNDEFVKLAKEINHNLGTTISEDAKASKKEVMDYLTAKNNWLFVFDNIKVNNNLVKDFINWEHNGNIIFCSQNSEGLPYPIVVQKFNETDAAKLAKTILENTNHESAELLVGYFNGYPLLIVQGAQLLNHMKGLNKEEYKSKIEQSTDKIKSNIILAIKELPPSSVRLLNKIALINNQCFSKQLLSAITDDPKTISDDIYHLSKFMLISNIDASSDNPVFEMHDVVAQKLIEVNGSKNSQISLEEIILNIGQSVPTDVMQGRIFRNKKTIPENFRVIFENSQKFDTNIYSLMELSFHTLNSHLNTFDYYNAEKSIDWFLEKDKANEFNLSAMTNSQKRIYGGFMGLIGAYYKSKVSDYHKSLSYYLKAKEVLDNVEGYDSYKNNIAYNLASTYIILGQFDEAIKYIDIVDQMVSSGQLDKSDSFYLFVAKSKLFQAQGKYQEALAEIEQAIEVLSNNGLQPNNLLYTNSYIIKAETLNALGKYQEALDQIQQVYNMHKSSKKDDHEVYGRIYRIMARGYLGQGNLNTALELVKKSIAVFHSDKTRQHHDSNYIDDPELGSSFVVQGDILFNLNNLKESITSYREAQRIYYYLYRAKHSGVEHLSYLYTQGAKAACKLKDLYHYKCFGRPQIKEFGMSNPKTISMLEYCKEYNLDLWSEGD